MTWWQVAAGDGGRDYSELFLKFGVFCIGPGTPGPYFDNPEAYRDNHTLRHFAEDIDPGHRLALRSPAGAGMWSVLALGEVVGDYTYEPAFEDVEGWDLQHVRRVRWRRVDVEPIGGLTRGTLNRVHGASALLEEMWERTEELAGELPGIPEPGRELNTDDLAWAFLAHGLSVERSERVTSTIERLSRLAGWYEHHRDEVSEHEIRTFLVVPLLAALGWPEQRMKIEWRRVDVALFDRPYSAAARATLLVESKRLGSGLGGAADQVRNYADEHPALRALVVTDGFRYLLYERRAQDWEETAYASLTVLRDRLPTRKLRGADTLFLKLLPETGPLGADEVAPTRRERPRA